MSSSIGQILPLAAGIAISPIPIIGVILMLLSPNARARSVGFLLGWIVGIVTAVVVFTVISTSMPEPGADGSNSSSATMHLVLGVLLLLLAARNWRRRPAVGEVAEAPGWMNAIDRIKLPAAAGLGFLLSAINPKNLLLAASAGLIIGGAALETDQEAVAIAVFALIAASTVTIPVIGYLFAADRMRAPLDNLRAWLLRENATIMAVLLLVIGLVVLGKGVGSF